MLSARSSAAGGCDAVPKAVKELREGKREVWPAVMAADTKDFDVFRIARSDGIDSGPGYWPVAAAPAVNAAKKTARDVAPPRAKAQMIRLDEDDPRFVEWRIKLGILLKQELSPNPEGGPSKPQLRPSIC